MEAEEFDQSIRSKYLASLMLEEIKVLLCRLASENNSVRENALRKLREHKEEADFVVKRLLESSDGFERAIGARGAGELKLEGTVLLLLKLLDDLNERVCGESELALARLGVGLNEVKTMKKIARELPLREAEAALKKELANPVVDLEKLRAALKMMVLARARRQPEYRRMLPRNALKAA